MTLALEQPQLGDVTLARGGVAAAGAIIDAAWDQQRYARNTNARFRALEEAYSRRIDAVKAATGITLDHPMLATQGLNIFQLQPGFDAEQARAFQSRLSDIAKAHPDKVDAIRPEMSIERQAASIAAEKEGRLADLLSRRSGLAGTALSLLGGFIGGLEDPTTLLFSLVGGGPATSLWRGAVRNAAINAGGAAAVEPIVQSWRKEAGLSHGIGEALEDIGAAAALGGGIDLGARLGWRALKAVPRLASSVRGAAQTAEAEQAHAAPPPGVSPQDHQAAQVQARNFAAGQGAPPEPGAPVAEARTPDLSDAAPPPAGAGKSFDVLGKPARFATFSPEELAVDAATFQFKGGGDASGVTGRLARVERWDPLAAGKIVVYQRADGALVVADGHQRVALAKKLTQEARSEATETQEEAGSAARATGTKISLEGYLFREADGWSPGDVRALAAKKNLQEGSGEVLDVARILRERPDILDSSVPRTSERMRQGRALSTLSDEAWAFANAEVLPLNHAALVGELVRDPARQADVMAELADAELPNAAQARLMIGEILSLPARAEVQETLFGAFMRQRSVMRERVAVLEASLKALRQDKRIFSTLEQEARRIESAGNRLAGDENQRRAVMDAQIESLLEALALKTGPASEALTRAATARSKGEPLTAARDAFVAEVRALFEREGLAGVLGTAEPSVAVAPMAEPAGAEAKAQMDALEMHLFHGTDVDSVTRFDTTGEASAASLGSATVERRQGGATFLTPSAEEARVYGRNVLPVTVRPGKTRVFDVVDMLEHDPAFLDALRAVVFEDWRARKPLGIDIDDPEGMENAFQRRLLDPLREDLRDQRAQEGGPAPSLPSRSYLTAAVIRMARAEGLDTATLRNMREGGEALTRGATDQVLLFNADNARIAAERVTNSREFIAAQPARSFDEIYALAPGNQAALAGVGQLVERASNDVIFRDPGPKNRADAEEKMARKGYRSTAQMTDIVRAGFEVETPGAADRVAARFAEHFDLLDEGWVLNDAGYFDRKLLVRFEDGMIGELQLWHPEMLEAKEKRGGHDLYERIRALPPDDPRRAPLVAEMKALYAAVAERFSPDWRAVLSEAGAGGASGKAAAKPSAESGRPLSTTSSGSTGVQSSPGASTATAADQSPATSAGRPSQAMNLREGVTTANIGPIEGPLQGLPVGLEAASEEGGEGRLAARIASEEELLEEANRQGTFAELIRTCKP